MKIDWSNEWIIMEQTHNNPMRMPYNYVFVWQQQQRRQSLIDPKKENWYSQVPFIHSFDGIYY